MAAKMTSECFTDVKQVVSRCSDLDETFRYPSLDYSAYLNKSDQIDKLIEHGRPRKLSTSKKLLPSSVDGLPPEGQDLLKRLLEIKPQYRIRSLLQLQRIGLYKNYDWDLVRKKQHRNEC
ncbi:conserved hypothetical protein [Culex quinquefasciatus]|uniref:Uncharacterized protein n=1 Tax=Culex quinquefasciatus TaxID=7176 RepID=B0WN40_CULQU|nr:conserved hypothetical protein [Culex quinquefasciatus]|eukprot:XP_001850124.1 conserved hypothetical protein [Culex quinquefasciatus]